MSTIRPVISLLALALALPALSQQVSQESLQAARYDDAGELIYPGNTDQWIHMGTTLGGDYNDHPFDADNPGVIGVVQMEPAAYQYFRENGDYTEGSMFLLSFYSSETKSSPQLQGFVQGELQAQEFHVIDPGRYPEGSAFFLFPEPEGSSTRVPDNSECIECHTQEGEFRSTFIQFYPTIRKLPRKG